ncbi:MAG: ATP-binding protein [Gammaproteobacteria bacterium]|nr:ATP-binding protein [Gammaproteobacteria bacterium]MDH5800844.1 ATP-binding protein [Gammaproteobacteria bacterium]
MNRNKLHSYGILLWTGVFLNFIVQGIFDQSSLAMVAGFSTYIIVSVALAKIVAETAAIKLPFKFYYTAFALLAFLSVALFYSGFGFTGVALPVALAVAIPMLHSSIVGFRAAKSNAMVKVYLVILTLNALHFLDYPFLRPIPEMAIVGFSLAFLFLIVLSIYLPIFTTKNISDTYAKALEEEIIQRQRMEEILRIEKAKAELAAQAKSDFLANVSHEIRTPLNGIIGITQLLLLEDLDKDIKERLKIVDDCADSLLAILNDIIDFSKIESGQLSLEKGPIELIRSIESAVSMYESMAAHKGLQLRKEISAGLPETIMGDLVRINQVIMNLLNNAIKFTQTGHVTLRVSKRISSHDQADILFQVVDTGIGIDADKMDTIFDSFNQGDNSATRKFGGTGLGLAICKQLVSMMGGELLCKSRLGEGSEFSFSLPLEVPAGMVKTA